MAKAKRHAGDAKYSSAPKDCLRPGALRKLYRKVGVPMFRKAMVDATRVVITRVLRRATKNALAIQAYRDHKSVTDQDMKQAFAELSTGVVLLGGFATKKKVIA